MKIKKIAQICAGQKTIYVHNQECKGDLVRQWVGDDVAMYPLDGLPYMDDEALLALMDVPPDKRDKWTVRGVGLGSVVSLDDVDPDEVDVLPYDLTVKNGLGRQLMDIANGTIVAEADARRCAAELDDEDQIKMEEDDDVYPDQRR